MLIEIWRPVVGYKDVYSISNFGRVRRDVGGQGARVGHILHPRNDGHKCGRADCKGYLEVALHFEGARQQRGVHQLVTEAFLGLAPFEGAVPNHKDGNGWNNALSNLEWVTRSYNSIHAYTVLGRDRLPGEARPNAKLTSELIAKIREKACHCGIAGRHKCSFKSQRELAAELGVSRSTVCAIISGRRWRHA